MIKKTNGDFAVWELFEAAAGSYEALVVVVNWFIGVHALIIF